MVLIFTHKPDLSPFEKISLMQCRRVLGNHPLRLVCPRGMRVERYLELAPGLEIEYIDPIHLSTYERYSHLKATPFLYDHFKEYEFMLVHELDSFVLRDELLDWCGAGWDYVGAPWFEGFDLATPDARYLGVGNGGFSLRCIESARRALHFWKRILPGAKVWKQRTRVPVSRQAPLPAAMAWPDKARSDVWKNEDVFWCFKVAPRFDWFRIPPVEEARKFAFELNPRRSLAEAGRLPFGCHKWPKYDLPFWKPIIESYRYELP